MNKDALLATLIGFGIGLLITGAFLFGPNILAALPSFSFRLPNFSIGGTKPVVSPIPSPAPRVTGLTVTAPLPETIAQAQDLLLSGTAPAGTTIVIAGPSDEAVVTANDANTFAGEIGLVEGRNDLVVTGYIDQKEDVKLLTVYYTPEDL